MRIESKDTIILLLGLIGSTWLFIWMESRNYFQKGLGLQDIIVILAVFTFAVILITYQKFKEINKDLELQNGKLERFSESLKRSNDLIEIKADIKELKRKLK